MNGAVDCPLCGQAVVDEVCPQCGSLEGLLGEEGGEQSVDQKMLQKPTQRQFSYSWGDGFVAPFVPSSSSSRKEAIFAAKVKRGERVVDLGCGDGGVCLCVAKWCGAEVVGVELDEGLVEKAREKARAMEETNQIQPNRCTFVVQNLFQVPLESFHVIFLFLLPETLQNLSPSLKERIQKGGRVVSFVWPVPNLEKYLFLSGGGGESGENNKESEHVWHLYCEKGWEGN